MILIIDDETYIRSSLAGMLEDEGYEAIAVGSAEKGEEILGREKVELILLDIQMPGKDGLTFLENNRERLENRPVIIISGRADIPTAVMAMKLGAYDFIEKPLVPERVLATVRQALRLSQSLEAERKLTHALLRQYTMVGRSEKMQEMRGHIRKAAGAEAHLLITGANGTGKELVVHAVHYLSSQKTEPLVIVNCPAIPEHLFESELFGYVKGAFTGAHGDRVGKMESAGRGTLVLDEIGDLPMPMQAKLLRVLENGTFERIGSNQVRQTGCRVMAVTNRDLAAMMTDGSFRQDLYFRLAVINIRVPSLAERTEDIPLLVEHFLKEAGVEGKYEMTSEAMGLIAASAWPGNIRQLRNFVHQLVFTCDPGRILPEHINRLQNGADEIGSPAGTETDNKLSAAIRQFEKGYLATLYDRHNGNIASMARHLGMDRANLSKKLKSLGLG